MGILDPLTSVLISFCLLGVMLYKRVKIGVTLILVSITLALLALDWAEIPRVIYETIDPFKPDGLIALLVIGATFGTAWLSYLYKETNIISKLSNGLNSLIKRPKIILGSLPAVLGLLPVPGGALLSAPIIDSESGDLSSDKKAYINIWFRHVIFPIYPLTQSLVVTAAVTGVPLLSIITFQIPVIVTMIAVGYLFGLSRASCLKSKTIEEGSTTPKASSLITALLPILVAISAAVLLSTISHELFQRGMNVTIAAFAGLATLAIISRPTFKTFTKPLKDLEIHDVMLATFDAFLLQNIMKNIAISNIFGRLILNGTIGAVWALTAIPVALSFFMGSPLGAITIAVSILTGALEFSLKNTALLYASAYLGYVIAPTHLCLIFTANYFKVALTRVYKIVIPSFIITYLATFLFYLLL